MEIFEVPIYDDDVIKLVFRLVVNLTVVYLLIHYVYSKFANSKEYLFTFFMLNILVFFICFTLKKFDLGLGMALGLFAIFGILRYRTTTIPIKEMTYLFTFIGIGIINSLSNKKMSYTELALTNAFIVGMAALLESALHRTRELRETIVYERIDLIRPEKHAELVADLQERTGIAFSRLELGKINFLNDTVFIDVFYYPHEQERVNGGDIAVTVVTRDY